MDNNQLSAIHSQVKFDFLKLFILCLTIMCEVAAIVKLWDPGKDKTVMLCVGFFVLVIAQVLAVIKMTSERRFLER